MPRTNCQDPDVLSSDKKAKTQHKLPKPYINLATLWCLQCFRCAVRHLDEEPFDVFHVACSIDVRCPLTCDECKDRDDKCDWVNIGCSRALSEKICLHALGLYADPPGYPGPCIRADGFDQIRGEILDRRHCIQGWLRVAGKGLRGTWHRNQWSLYCLR